MDFFGLSFEPAVEKVLLALEEQGRHENFWNVPRSTAVLLHEMVMMSEAKNVLEIGTSNGYSGIFLADAARRVGGRLYTVESHNERFELAALNFTKAGVVDVITQVKGHAPEVLNELDGVLFDMVFLDATKMEYTLYLEAIVPRVRKGGLLIADNILSHWNELESFVERVRARKDTRSYLLEIDSGLLLAFTGL